MARKHSPDRKPYSPVDEKLTRSLPTVISTVSPETEDVESVTPSPEIVRVERPSSVPSEEQGKLRSSNLEKLNKQIRFQVSDAERREIRRIVSRLSGELETSVDMSHVARALFLIFRHSEVEIIKHVRLHCVNLLAGNDLVFGCADE